MLFGQSYQLFGLNSFAVQDSINTGVDSGLARQQSDYVARVNYSPNRTYTFSVRGRFDQQTANVQRFEAEARANFDRWSVSMIYGNYAPQADLGYLTRREGLLGSASLKVAANSNRWLKAEIAAVIAKAAAVAMSKPTRVTVVRSRCKAPRFYGSLVRIRL